MNIAYPTSLNTLGDHLRKVRLDRGLSQPQVANLLKVTTDTITGWELNRHAPPMRLAKEILSFLGYFPFQINSCSIVKQLYFARLVLGHTQEQAARMMRCDESNIRYIELGKRNPQIRIFELIEEYIDYARGEMVKYIERNKEE